MLTNMQIIVQRGHGNTVKTVSNELSLGKTALQHKIQINLYDCGDFKTTLPIVWYFSPRTRRAPVTTSGTECGLREGA